MPRPLRVFLCYASQDKSAVRELYNALKSEGWIDPWLDKAKILPGQDWEMAIEKAVDASDVVVICLTNQSVTKEGFVQREIRYAYDLALEKPEGTIFLIPLRLDDCLVPRKLRTIHWVDYFGAQKQEAHADLLEALKLRHDQKMKLEAQEEERKEAKKKAKQAVEELARKPAIEKNVHEKEESKIAEKVDYEENRKVEDKYIVGSILSEFPKQTIADKTLITPKWISIFWIMLGWAASAAFSDKILTVAFMSVPSGPLPDFLGFTTVDFIFIVFGAINGLMGGLVMTITLRSEHLLSGWKSMLWIILSWTAGLAIGVEAGWVITDNYPNPLGWVISGIIGGLITAITLRNEHVLFSRKSILLTTLGWVVGWTIFETIRLLIIFNLHVSVDGVVSSTIVSAFGGASGGFIMIRQVRKERSNRQLD